MRLIVNIFLIALVVLLLCSLLLGFASKITDFFPDANDSASSSEEEVSSDFTDEPSDEPSDEPTDEPTEQPNVSVIDVSDFVSYEGWQARKDWNAILDGKINGYDAIGVLFDFNPVAIAAYEALGYKVEYGSVLAVGSMDGIRYGYSSSLFVEEVGGKLISLNGHEGTLVLAYSSDENAVLDDCIVESESELVRVKAIKEFGGTIYVEGDQSLDNKTYVAAGFVRLTDADGNIQIGYVPARECLEIVPLTTGDVGPTDEPSDEPSDEPTEEPTDEPTDEPTEHPSVSLIDVSDFVSYEGWQARNDFSAMLDGEINGYDAVGVLFDFNPVAIAAYEALGYKVEYGSVLAVGSFDGIRYSYSSTLSVEEEDGKLVSPNEYATLVLAYSSDEDAILDDCIVGSGSELVRVKAIKEFGGTIYIEGDQSLDNMTYVAAGFVRLTDADGNIQIGYVPARECLEIVPLTTGDVWPTDEPSVEPIDESKDLLVNFSDFFQVN